MDVVKTRFHLTVVSNRDRPDPILPHALPVRSHYRRQTANLQTRIHIYNVGSILGCQFEVPRRRRCVLRLLCQWGPLPAHHRSEEWRLGQTQYRRPQTRPASHPLVPPSSMPISATCNIHPLPKTDSPPRNPRKTIVLAASRRLSKGQPRNATLNTVLEIYLETRCIKHVESIPSISARDRPIDVASALPILNLPRARLGSRGDIGSNLLTLFSFSSRM